MKKINIKIFIYELLIALLTLIGACYCLRFCFTSDELKKESMYFVATDKSLKDLIEFIKIPSEKLSFDYLYANNKKSIRLKISKEEIDAFKMALARIRFEFCSEINQWSLDFWEIHVKKEENEIFVIRLYQGHYYGLVRIFKYGDIKHWITEDDFEFKIPNEEPYFYERVNFYAPELYNLLSGFYLYDDKIE